jgi:hypothetical protein
MGTTAGVCGLGVLIEFQPPLLVTASSVCTWGKHGKHLRLDASNDVATISLFSRMIRVSRIIGPKPFRVIPALNMGSFC